MLSFVFFSASFLSASLHAAKSEDPYSTQLKRINNHFIIRDYASARLEAAEALTAYPDSKEITEAYIQALARAGEEKNCIDAWKHYTAAFPYDEKSHERVIEEIAWGTINKTASSSSFPLRLMGILAAFLSQDARGITLLQQGLQDPNAAIRGATVKLAGNLHDAVLQDEVIRLVTSENTWKVRLEAIKAAGGMKLKQVKPILMRIASNNNISASEQAVAIASIVEMQNSISREGLTHLIQSNRAGMRILACEIVAHLELKKDTDLLMPLLNDHSAQVRAQVVYTLGRLRVPLDLQKGSVARLMKDPDPIVAITAAWTVSLTDPETGQKVLEVFLDHADPKTRRLAAGALVAAGYYGFPLIKTAFKNSQDPYVRLNLALGLIGQRYDTLIAADEIFKQLSTVDERWMKEDDSFFSSIAPSTIKHDELVPNYPEAVNQQTRLELLNLLAVLNYPRAQEAIKQFLKERKWGITGMASAVLLTEGDEEAVDIVEKLLDDQDSSIQLQAALILALWGGDEKVLTLLENAYAAADYEDKEKIIEAIGRIGSKKSIPFLLLRLEEPHQSLRLIAAAGLVQILYS